MKKIFERNPGKIQYTSFMNWRIDVNGGPINMITIASGFMKSVDELCSLCLENNNDKKADILIFPIFANMNHAIELYLKSIIWSSNILLKSKVIHEGVHDLKQIQNIVKSKVGKLGGDPALNNYNSGSSNLDSYIEELYFTIGATQKEAKIDFSRYPITKKNRDNHFYLDDLGNIEIDIINLRNRFSQIKEFLDDRAWYYYNCLNE